MTEPQTCDICGEAFSATRPRRACDYCDRAVCSVCVEDDVPDHHCHACRECMRSWDPYRELRQSSPEELIRIVADPRSKARAKAVDLIRAQRLRQAVPVLIDALRSRDQHLRHKLVEALRQLADPEAVPALVAALGDSYPDVRREAALALGEMGAEAAVKPLIKALSDPDDWVLEGVAAAVGELQARAAVRHLGKALEKRNEGVGRWAVVTALGRIGGEEARKLLEAALEDDDRWVRHYAATALIALDPSLEALLQEHLL